MSTTLTLYNSLRHTLLIDLGFAELYTIPMSYIANRPWLRRALYNSLRHHGVSDLHEAGDVGTLDIVDIAIGLLAILDALLMDGRHNLVQLLVDLSFTPA